MIWLSLLACGPHKLDLDGPYGMTEAPSITTAQPDRLRFLVVGDIGERIEPDSKHAMLLDKWEKLSEPHPEQATIAKAAKEVCAGDCDFVTLLGDNVYPTGFRQGKELEFDELLLHNAVDNYGVSPAYLVLGNHDWHPAIPRLRRAQRQLDYIHSIDTWEGDHHFYAFDAGPARVVVLDTNYLVRRPRALKDPALTSWVEEQLDPDRWTIVVGHHPLRSWGQHGDAGHYRERGLRFWPAVDFREWTDRVLVGKIDLYLAGHEHDLQLYDLPGESKNTLAVISGAAGTCSKPPNQPRSAEAPTYLRYGYGFVVIETTPDRLRLEVHGVEGERLWSTSRAWKGVWEHDPKDVDLVSHCVEDAERMRALQQADE